MVVVLKWSWYSRTHQPAHLVQNNDIIVITCNYRLGALGYLDWSYFNKDFHSNNGLSDQINVIKWVHQFIDSLRWRR